MRTQLIAIAAAFLFYSCGVAAERPNVVLILVDDLGYGDLSCFRALAAGRFANSSAPSPKHYPETPNIDALAKQGVRLTQYYAASPVCSASRAAITTGRFPGWSLINSYLSDRTSNRRHGMCDWLDPRGNSMARLFQKAGYATAHVGKWHLGGGRDIGDAPLPTEYGFGESLTSFEGLGDRILPPGRLSDQSAALGRGNIERVDKHVMTRRYVDRCVDFIERNRSKEFYLQLWLDDVHDVHAPAPGEEEKFASETDNPHEQKFFAVLTEMDRQIGRLVAKIDELGLGDETLICLTSDNGPTAWPSYASARHDAPGSTAGFRGRKWSLYEGGIRMPLVARWTGHIPPNEINRTQLSSSVDLLPTFAALCGLDTTQLHSLEGIDISRALLRPSDSSLLAARPALLFEYGREDFYLRPALPVDRSPNLAIREPEWKLLMNDDGTSLELYAVGLQGEIDEYNNVAGHHPDVVQQLSSRLLSWRKSLPALPSPLPVPDALTVRDGGVNVVKLPAGTSLPSEKSPDIASRAFKITTRVNGTADGAIVAQGGSAAGYALYVQNGQLKFTVRARSQEATVSTVMPAGDTTIIAELAGDGAMSLRVNDLEPVKGKSASTIPNQPGDGIAIGRDLKSPVGNYQSPFQWNGQVESVEVALAQAAAEPKTAQLVTRWAKDVDPEHPLPEYPRPQMVREKWLNLNGHWDYAIVEGGELKAKGQGGAKLQTPEKWEGRIVVPFCIESILSGVQKRVSDSRRLWYHKSVTLPKDWNPSDRILLNFGAVDWECVVLVNGREVGHHRGGYDPFTFDITSALHADRSQSNEIAIAVWDPTDSGSQPRGKQVKDPKGIWYTPVTGIWQTVWLEPVQSARIKDVTFHADLDRNSLRCNVTAEVRRGKGIVEIAVSGDGLVTKASSDTTVGEGIAAFVVDIPLNNPKLWTPSEPFLYDASIELRWNFETDHVDTYAALRKIHFQKDEHGHNRLYLNNKPLFQYGPLDQGWWPDGLYTAPTDEALRYDIEVTRRLGFNMARKHVKVEPQRWYYWCDKLGLLVWQDMPSGMKQGGNQFVKQDWAEDAVFTSNETEQFRTELKALIDTHRNHPCIVAWVPFNEGWGQHATNDILKWVKEYDPTRIVGGPSGWLDRGYGDMKDMHKYPGPGMFPVMEDRVSVLGEFGGLGLPLEGHTLLAKNNWGYRTYTTRDELQKNYDTLLLQLPGLIADGLAAAIYTQTTDVEIEVNGLMTYDRQVIKFDEQRLNELHQPLYGPILKKTVLIPTAREAKGDWKYTLQSPRPGWTLPAADVSNWSQGECGFGTAETPNATVGTAWNSSDIWIRRTFPLTLPDTGVPEGKVGGQVLLRVFHDEDATVYLNSIPVADLKGYVSDYIDIPLRNDPTVWLKNGENVLSVHCRQSTGGQYIDAGLYWLSP